MDEVAVNAKVDVGGNVGADVTISFGGNWFSALSGVVRGQGAKDIVDGVHDSASDVLEAAAVALGCANKVVDKDVNDFEVFFVVVDVWWFGGHGSC